MLCEWHFTTIFAAGRSLSQGYLFKMRVVGFFRRAAASSNKDDELVTIEGFELLAVHVPGSLLASLVETGLFFLPHEEGSGEGFHGHDDIDLDPYAFFSLLEGMLQAPVLFGVPEQIVLDEAAIIVAIKGDNGS